MPPVTKTIGPLHLEDLEPHRFEDLVRQLLYDFRQWQDLEATGRLGGDDGFDVRAREIASQHEVPAEGPEREQGDPDDDETGDGRLWLIQCKREKNINPSKLSKYLAELPDAGVERLYGIVFVAACDFSKKSRDLFYERTRRSGFMEVKIWGKAEIEDQLFQPKNDHLLFAYFGLSLQVRKRSLKTAVRARLATKRKAEKYLSNYRRVLVRDASDDRYPYPNPDKSLPPIQRRRWKVFQCNGCHHDGVHFVQNRYYAYIADDLEHWDAVETLDRAQIHYIDDPWCPRENRSNLYRPSNEYERIVKDQWEALEDKNKAWLEYNLILPFENILAIDEEGDEFTKNPHVYVSDFNGGSLPFHKNRCIYIENTLVYGRSKLPKITANRVAFFALPTPETLIPIQYEKLGAQPIDDD